LILMSSAARIRAMRPAGTLFCLGSGAAFGAMAVFGKLAYGEAATVGTLLAIRFVLVVAGTGAGALDPLGVALGLGAAVVYTTYILVGAGIVARVRPWVLSALVCTGAAVSLTAGSALLGELRPGALSAAGWGWLACLAAVLTVASISLFFAGLRRAGATTASILATVEPLVTIVLAFLIFGETLGVLQLVGGALGLSGTLVLHMRLAPNSDSETVCRHSRASNDARAKRTDDMSPVARRHRQGARRDYRDAAALLPTSPTVQIKGETR
jgi:uncharacterized membrane protein